MFFPEKKKKKVDYEALNSSLMRIPRMDVAAARSLIDLGIREIYELQGRAPEVLMEEAKRKNPGTPDDRIRFFRLAVYYAENPEHEASKLHPDAWN
ncbi:helix-hairpin-helix domain-containing protein [Coraliomargarita parva]|uniref:helix-hairpin-helix domain-containing protein n=1 Tax=Coraliomargarita parva TaxID=3014050 RepID=UPI0022B32345|nr:helix-hairpin-helix domain-containing protein [Coraliomargarita parva]